MGRWTAVDLAKEFHDSYRYTTNPIGFIDLDGLAELRYALYMVEYQGYAQSVQDRYQPFVKKGDNLIVKAFTPDQTAEMYAFLKEADKGHAAIAAHSYDGSGGLFYKIWDNLLKWADLNNEMALAKKSLYVDACDAEENLPKGNDTYTNLNAVPGASGPVYGADLGMKSIGVDVPAKKTETPKK